MRGRPAADGSAALEATAMRPPWRRLVRRTRCGRHPRGPASTEGTAIASIASRGALRRPRAGASASVRPSSSTAHASGRHPRSPRFPRVRASSRSPPAWRDDDDAVLPTTTTTLKWLLLCFISAAGVRFPTRFNAAARLLREGAHAAMSSSQMRGPRPSMMGVSDAVTRTRCASATPLTESFFDACSSGPTQRSQNRNGFAFYFSRFEAKARGGERGGATHLCAAAGFRVAVRTDPQRCFAGGSTGSIASSCAACATRTMA